MRRDTYVDAYGSWALPLNMPHFIGCVQFGRLGVKESSSSNIVVVADNLHDANMPLLEVLVKAGRRSNFSSQQETAKNK